MIEKEVHSDIDLCYRNISSSMSSNELVEFEKQLIEAQKKIESEVLSAIETLTDEHPILCTIDLFKVLAIDRREVAHTAVLARLLDPQGGHGAGVKILERVLCEYGNLSEEIDEKTVSCEAEHVITEEKSKGRRIDVLASGKTVSGKSWNMIIEAKVDASEQKEQLDAYRQYVSCKKADYQVFIFLTTDGREGETDSSRIWSSVSYLDLFFMLNDVAAHIECSETQRFLRWYCGAILRWFCGLGNCFLKDGIENPYRLMNLLRDRRWRLYEQ